MLEKKVSLPMIIALFAGLFLAVSAVLAQPQSEGPGITGKVVDVKSGNPLSGIQVTIEGTRLVSITDEKGMFNFTDLKTGLHKLTIAAKGYKPVTKEVDVKEEGAILTVELEPDNGSNR